jgi:outer membrane protein TolC
VAAVAAEVLLEISQVMVTMGQVAQAVDAVVRDRARVDLATATLAAAEAGLAADQELYREGRGSTRDVVRSLEVLEEAQVGRLAAEIDLQAAWLALARLRGRVLEEMVEEGG